MWVFFKQCNEHSGSKKKVEINNQMTMFYLIENDSVPLIFH